MRQTLGPGRVTLVSLACTAMLAACGGGGDGGGGGAEGQLQVINFQYPGGGTLLAGPQTLVATATSGLPVTFSSGTPSICTVSGDQMTLVSAGECMILAAQDGGTADDGVKWARADTVSHLFQVLKHPQTVALEAPDYLLSTDVSEVALSASASSGLPVTLSGGTPGVCTISDDNKVVLLGKGSCAVTAVQAGDENYEEAKADRFIAVDPLIVADGILGAGQGTTNSALTKQNGAVTANPWSSIIGGWEWCGNTDDTCFREVSADEKTFTSALRIPKSSWTPGGWHYSFNNIDIFVPGLSGFNQGGDTTGGLQVTTETTLGLTLGVNKGLFDAKKPVVVQMDLGKRNNDCNVTASTLLWPAVSGSANYGISLQNFALTEACGLAGVTAASLDNDVRKLPNPWGTGPGDAAAAAAAFQAALDAIKPARDSAMELIKSSNIVRVRLRLMDINADTLSESDGDFYASDLSITGAITIQ